MLQNFRSYFVFLGEIDKPKKLEIYVEYSANTEENSRKFPRDHVHYFFKEKIEFDGRSSTSETEMCGFAVWPSTYHLTHTDF